MESAQEDDRASVTTARHAVVVLPSNGAFDSRTYRIATTLLARGHRVTVIARLQAGFPEEELHPAGYRIIRVRVRAADAIPLRSAFRRVRDEWRRLRRVPGGPRTRGDGPAWSGDPSSRNDADRVALRRPRARRLHDGLVRRFAIPLAIRAHVRAALAVAPDADLYHGMAYMGVPVAIALGRRSRAPVVYDARDIYLEARNMARSRGPARWVYAAMERRWSHQVSRVITVNEDYANELERRLRVPRPLVVMNCSNVFSPPAPRERRFHELLGLPTSTRVVLYHGGLFPERGIEQLIAAIDDVPEAILVLMGYGVLEPTLRTEAEARAGDGGGRVRLAPPVGPEELHAWIACADVVAMPIQASTLNHRLTTPNKLFEAMAAGVPVVASDLIGMARIVRETGCGVLVDGSRPDRLAEALRDVLGDDERRQEMGRRGLEAVARTYNWERQGDILLREYERLTGTAW